MGKKQHQKDKLYLTTREWKEIGGHKDDTGTRMQRAQFKRLPITHCALSLLPFEDPVCTTSGEIFDLTYAYLILPVGIYLIFIFNGFIYLIFIKDVWV
uniref:Uncharacterized protein n=1 Tax=Heterorhabditis bacteriophora TaxID=37862 RepID=A0A1I7XDY3_HETBA